MSSSCDWCGESADEIALELSHADHRPGVPFEPADPEGMATDICKNCTERLAKKMANLQRTLGLNPDGTQKELARKMVSVIDLVNSEPPEREWEETLPAGSTASLRP